MWAESNQIRAEFHWIWKFERCRFRRSNKFGRSPNSLRRYLTNSVHFQVLIFVFSTGDANWYPFGSIRSQILSHGVWGRICSGQRSFRSNQHTCVPSRRQILCFRCRRWYGSNTKVWRRLLAVWFWFLGLIDVKCYPFFVYSE